MKYKKYPNFGEIVKDLSEKERQLIKKLEEAGYTEPETPDDDDDRLSIIYSIIDPPKDDKSPKDLNRAILSWRIRTGRTLMTLHGLNPDVVEVDYDHLDILKISKLKDDRKKAKRTSSIMFRARFMTEFITHVNKHIIDMIDNLSDNNWNIFQEWGTRYEALTTITRDIELFICEYAKGYTHTIKDALFLMGLSSPMLKKKRLKLWDLENEQREMIIEGISTKNKLPDDLIIYTLFKLSYCMIIGKVKPKKIEIDSLEGLSIKNKVLIKKLLRTLGRELIEKKDELNPMFDAYVQCNPMIWSTIDQSEVEVVMGIYGLTFYGWVTGSKEIMRYIEKMLK